jgi:predicted negative regulator of RcsB-dependent stress response
MAETNASAPFGGDLGEQRFSEFWDRYRQHLAWIGLVLIVAIAGAWFYVRSESLKQEHAETAFEQALVGVQSGNIRLAESDLKKVVSRYGGTNGGAEAAMTLAKLSYQQGNYQAGIDALKTAVSTKGDMQFEALVLQGAGYEGLSKWADAARTYDQAADAARFPEEKAQAQAMAARAYQAGGDKANAAKIWEALLKDPKNGFDNEAKVRLGELQAAPMKV